MQSYITIKVKRTIKYGLEQHDVMVNGVALHTFPSEWKAKEKAREIISKLYARI